MKNNILSIDTSNNETITVGLVMNGKEKKVKRTLDKKRAQVVLPIIEELLLENGLKPADLTGIRVNAGPGSFTGLRVGVSIANTLGIFLKIPINNQPVGTIVEPTYS